MGAALSGGAEPCPRADLPWRPCARTPRLPSPLALTHQTAVPGCPLLLREVELGSESFLGQAPAELGPEQARGLAPQGLGLSPRLPDSASALLGQSGTSSRRPLLLGASSGCGDVHMGLASTPLPGLASGVRGAGTP